MSNAVKANRTKKPKMAVAVKSKKEEACDKLWAISREKSKAMEEVRANRIKDPNNVELKKKADRAVEAWKKTDRLVPQICGIIYTNPLANLGQGKRYWRGSLLSGQSC
jgi:hypothetical protein